MWVNLRACPPRWTSPAKRRQACRLNNPVGVCIAPRTVLFSRQAKRFALPFRAKRQAYEPVHLGSRGLYDGFGNSRSHCRGHERPAPRSSPTDSFCVAQPEPAPALGVYAARTAGHAPGTGRLGANPDIFEGPNGADRPIRENVGRQADRLGTGREEPIRLWIGDEPRSDLQATDALGRLESAVRGSGYQGQRLPERRLARSGRGRARSKNGRALLLRCPGQCQDHSVAGAADAAGVGRRLRPERLAATCPGGRRVVGRHCQRVSHESSRAVGLSHRAVQL